MMIIPVRDLGLKRSRQVMVDSYSSIQSQQGDYPDIGIAHVFIPEPSFDKLKVVSSTASSPGARQRFFCRTVLKLPAPADRLIANRRGAHRSLSRRQSLNCRTPYVLLLPRSSLSCVIPPRHTPHSTMSRDMSNECCQLQVIDDRTSEPSHEDSNLEECIGSQIFVDLRAVSRTCAITAEGREHLLSRDRIGASIRLRKAADRATTRKHALGQPPLLRRSGVGE